VEGEEDLSIVNPLRLSRDLNEAICNQCHLESVASAVVRGQSREAFRPGLAWNDFVANYAYQEPRGGMTVTGHVEQMHASRCYQKSDALTCTTCHDPHHSPRPDERREHYRMVCLSCHDEKACRASPEARFAKNQDECAACHMPRSAVEIPHLAFTHHRIGLHPAAPQNLTDEKAAATALVPVLDVSQLAEIDQQRLLGLGYWRHHVQSDDTRLPTAQQSARELLSHAAKNGLHDGSVAAPLAAIALERGDAPLAKREAERALGDSTLAPRDRVLASELLAALYVQENRLAEASGLLKQLIALRPHPQYWFLLGVCRQRQGDVTGAIEAMERVLALDPAGPATYRFLASLQQLRGDFDSARRQVERADVLEANLPP
jgi:predicted CXXCH cytochrome family protein